MDLTKCRSRGATRRDGPFRWAGAEDNGGRRKDEAQRSVRPSSPRPATWSAEAASSRAINGEISHPGSLLGPRVALSLALPRWLSRRFCQRLRAHAICENLDNAQVALVPSGDANSRAWPSLAEEIEGAKSLQPTDKLHSLR